MESLKSLRSKTVKELREIAKELNIVGRWEMNKKLLIENIEHIQEVLEIKKEQEEMENKKTTKDYAKDIPVGTIVAFDSKGKTYSAKIRKITEKTFEVETITGKIFDINKDSVIWYKTGARWPKFVYNKLKGIEDEQTRKVN